MQIDFETLRRLSKDARENYGLAGAVQHGASTLPEEAFHNFPKTETCEIHLATNFQTMLYDHFPSSLRDDVYAWLRENAKDERKPSDSDEQFYYKTRKKAIGPFKKQIWGLPPEVKRDLAEAYDKTVAFLFSKLAVADTTSVVSRLIELKPQHRPPPHEDLSTARRSR